MNTFDMLVYLQPVEYCYINLTVGDIRLSGSSISAKVWTEWALYSFAETHRKPTISL